MPTVDVNGDSKSPKAGDQTQPPDDSLMKKAGDFFLSTAVTAAPMVMSASFGLVGVAAGMAAIHNDIFR